MLVLFAKGGILVIPILLCSVIALAIFLESVIRFAVLRKRGLSVAGRVADYLKKNEIDAAVQETKKNNSPMGRVLAQAIDVLDQDRETLETVLVHAVEKEIRTLSRYLQVLATIGNIAPLLGLLGTVIGMIKAFMVIQQMGGKVNAAILAGGIWEAMLTTALGLAVALPVIVAHSYLMAQVDRYEARLQEGTVEFIKSTGAIRGN